MLKDKIKRGLSELFIDQPDLYEIGADRMLEIFIEHLVCNRYEELKSEAKSDKAQG